MISYLRPPDEHCPQLATLARTHSSFRIVAERMLYHELRLTLDNDACLSHPSTPRSDVANTSRSAVLTLEQRPELAETVRSVWIDSNDGTEIAFRRACQLLKHCSHLEELHLSTDFCWFAPLVFELKADGALNTVVELELSSLTWDMAEVLFKTWPGLKRLRLSDGLQDEMDGDDERPFLFELESFAASWTVHHRNMHLLLHNSVHSLTRLELSAGNMAWPDRDAEPLPPFPALRDLIITSIYDQPSYFPNSGVIIPMLPPFIHGQPSLTSITFADGSSRITRAALDPLPPQIHSLTVGMIPIDWEDLVDWLGDDKVRPPNLRKLVLPKPEVDVMVAVLEAAGKVDVIVEWDGMPVL